MSQVFITENILRDAHQCLIATRMRTEHMLPICEKLDKVGFWSLEAWGGATFDACVRFLKEDPFQRLKQLKEKLPNTPIMMLLRGQNLLGYRHYADDVVEKFIQCSAKNGVDIFRIFDALNDLRNLSLSIKAVKACGKHAQGAISYTVSPVHNIESYLTLAKEFQKLGCDSIAIKDMAGLLTPKAIVELVKALQKAVDIPLHIHSHATSGLAPIVLYEAVMNGCRHIDTANSSFAEGASHAATEAMVAAFRGSPYETNLDLHLLQEISDYFRDVRKQYSRFESEATRVDPRVHINQIPGGMISNLYNQLKEQNALEKLTEVLKEVPKVRQDLGFPPLVTPTSQVVGTQAVLNVLTGERYKTITNEVKLYLKGQYGKAPGTINKSVQMKAIGQEDVITCRPADLIKNEFSKLEKDIGDLAKSEEDVLIYSMFPDVGKSFLQARADNNLIPEPLNLEEANKSCEPIKKSKKFNVSLHGETYQIEIKGAGHQGQRERPIYLTVDQVPEEILLEDLDVIVTDQAGQSNRPPVSKPGHVSVAMPCLIVDVKMKLDDKVQAGDVLLITEAMKMETEVQAPIAGVIKEIYVNKGEQVNPDEALLLIE